MKKDSKALDVLEKKSVMLWFSFKKDKTLWNTQMKNCGQKLKHICMVKALL